MKSNFQNIQRSMIVALVALGALFSSTNASARPNVDDKGIAVQGYDAVAFFRMSKPIKGSSEFSTTYENGTYLFQSKENLDAFLANPKNFLPQFDGYCAYGVTKGAKFPIQIETWQIVDGRLLLNKNPEVKVTFEKDLKGNIKKADAMWPEVMKK